MLEGSNPNKLLGCSQYLTEIGEKRGEELKMDRQTSLMQTSDARDIRDHCNETENF